MSFQQQQAFNSEGRTAVWFCKLLTGSTVLNPCGTFFFCSAAIIGFPALASGSDPTSTPTYQPRLLVDVSAISDADNGQLVSALGVFVPKDAGREIVVKADDNLYQIVDRNYRYSDGSHRSTADALAQVVASVNGLDSIDRIVVGQRIQLPPLPVRPYAGVGPDGGRQVFSLPSGDIYGTFKYGKDWRFGTDGAVTQWATAAVVDVQFTPEQAKVFLEHLPEDSRRRILSSAGYLGPGADLVNVQTPEVQAAPSGHSANIPKAMTLPPSVLSSFLQLTPAQVGKYYILDFFGQADAKACAHGNLVRDKAVQVLRELGAAHLVNSIEIIDIDFFGNRKAGLAEIDAYIQRQPSPAIRSALKRFRDTLEQARVPEKRSEAREVPLLYLQALYDNLLSKPDTSVISSSFYMYIDGFAVLPNSYARDSKVPLLTAVTNEQGSYVEDATRLEPIRSFLDHRHEYGTYLVGAESQQGGPMGMTSKFGDGVSVVYPGAVVAESGPCKGETKLGTSFATPAIGAMLLLARAYWNSQGAKLTAVQARTRLLLSSQVMPAHVNRYASAGSPHFPSMLFNGDAYAVTVEEKVIPISEFVDHSFVKLKASQEGLPIEKVLRRGKNVSGFSGLKVAHGQVFLFSEDSMRWEAVELTSVRFANDRGEVSIDSVEALLKTYTEVILL